MNSNSDADNAQQRFQDRGIKRRDKLVAALRVLLSEKEIREVRYQEVADLAGIPLPSCYNLFKSKADLIQALAEYYAPLFNAFAFAPLEEDAVPNKWSDLVEVMVDRAVLFVDKHVAARRVWFGFDIPAQVADLTRQRERITAVAYRKFISRYFELPAINDLDEYFYLALEIGDRIMHVAEYGGRDHYDFYIAEAKRAQIAYLSVHVPPALPRTSVITS